MRNLELTDYKSVQNWLIKSNGERRYKDKTEERNLEYLAKWIKFLNKTPDEMVNVSDEEAYHEVTIITAELLKSGAKQSAFQEHSYKFRVFLRYNGVKLKRYDTMRAVWRATRVDPKEVESLVKELKERKSVA